MGNRLRSEASSNYDGNKKRLITPGRQITNIVDTVAAGQASHALLERLGKLESEKSGLELNLSDSDPEPVLFHPNVADLYVSRINSLRNTLNEEGTQEESSQIIRGLIDEIRLHPINGELHIELIGDLAPLLLFAEEKDSNNKKHGSYKKPGSTKWLVAGARNQRYLHLDYASL